MNIKLLPFLLIFLAVVSLVSFAGDINYRGEASAFRIIQKSSSALYDADSYERIIEEWYQGPYVHRKSKYTQQIKDLTDIAVEGRISYSYYGFNLGDSDSFWVKSYTIRGVPFSWNSKKKKWKNKALHIEDKYAREQISYSFLQNLGGIDVGGVDPDSLKFIGEEEKNGKMCYLVSYNYLSDMLKSWGLVGKLSVKLWVEKETFLPVKKRIEGNIAGLDSLAVITYQKYGEDFDFDLPDYVSQESAKEKKVLESKIDRVIAEVAKIRGWQPSEIKDVTIEFAKKNRIKDALIEDLRISYSDQELVYEGQMLKWLGLIPKDADYLDIVFDSSDVGFIAGLYIPRTKTIFVADNLAPAQAEVTLAHEVVHAFQDKKLDLQKLKKTLKNDTNAYRALMCLVEGEAAALHLEYLLNKSDETLREWEDISRLIDEKVVRGYSRDKVFYNVYGYGAIFIQEYLKKNSWAWNRLGQLYRDYPKTMKEIIHPDEYNMKSALRGVNLGKTKPRSLDSFRFEGWESVYTNKLGEYHLFLMLDEKLKRAESKLASIGWSNDRIDIYEKPDKGSLIVLLTVWDTAKDANEFYRAYQNWLGKKKFVRQSEEVDNDIFINSGDSQITGCFIENNRVTIVGTQDVELDSFKQMIKTKRGGL